MKKNYYLLILITLFASISSAQQIQFEQVLPAPPSPQYNMPFCDVSNGDISFGDIDGDNDQDVLITGSKSGFRKTKLYKNDGNGNFIIVDNTPFSDVDYSSVAFADIDGDNDLDLLITGKMYDNGYQYIANLYTNDGNGNFTEVNNTPFTGVANSSVAFADIDNDNDQDLLITGFYNDGTNDYYIAKLYTNDGNGNFTEVNNTPFTGVTNSSIAFADIDNDNDQDVIITGKTSDSMTSGTTKLYTNDGNGNFVEVSNNGLISIDSGSVVFGDIDGDNDKDLLLTGINVNQYYTQSFVSKLYTNDGNGNFTEVNGTSFEGAGWASNGFFDFDNDNDLDILITGYNNTSNVAKLYSNDGNGNYSEVLNTTFDEVSNSNLDFADINGDNYLDIMIIGEYESTSKTNVYINNAGNDFSKVVSSPFIGVSDSSVAFADIDGDNNKDLLLTGYIKYNSPVTKLYHNDGNGNFDEISGTPFPNVGYSSVAFADIDNDNDQDLLITGKSQNGNISKLFINDGSGNFTEDTVNVFTGVSKSKVVFVDIDNDNDQDLIITGHDGSNTFTALYINDGNGIFTENTNVNFVNVKSASIGIADIDGDNDKDILLTGDQNSFNPITKLYINNNDGTFTEDNNNFFSYVMDGDVVFTDIDNDQDQDLILIGYTGSIRATKLYTNDGNGIFTEINNTGFEDFNAQKAAFFDIDGDNDDDLFLNSLSSGSKFFINDGNGNFSELQGIELIGVYASSIALADIDNDNDQDIFITGSNYCFGNISYLYKNTSSISGVINETTNDDIIIYPNPSSQIFYLDNLKNDIKNIKIFNVQGVEIPFEYHKMSQMIKLNAKKGIYLISIMYNNTKITKKLFVK